MASRRFDAAIVGGGVIGWSTAWHLLRRERTLRVAVIDPDPSRCTSLRGAGGSRAQFASEVNIALSLASIEEFKRYGSEVGGDIRYRQHGYLLFTADPERAQAMQRLADYQRSHGVPIEEVPIEEVKSRVPALETRDLVYAQIGVADGYMDGPQVQKAYRAAAIHQGAVEVQAKALSVAPDCVSTAGGDVYAGSVVVATGHWSAQLGLDLPVRPEKHQLFYAFPKGIKPTFPFVIDIDTTFHFRPHEGGILICYNDPELSSQEHAPDDSPTFEMEVLERLQPIADHRAPGLLTPENTLPGRAGFYAVTPDRHPILGKKDGIFIATGFAGHGVMHSPAAGRLVAEMILDGEARSIDVSRLSPDRFERGELVEETMVF